MNDKDGNELSLEEQGKKLKEHRPYLDGGIRQFDGYCPKPIFKWPENYSVYYNAELDGQVRVPCKSLAELREELGLTQEPIEKEVTRTLELPK